MGRISKLIHSVRQKWYDLQIRLAIRYLAWYLRRKKKLPSLVITVEYEEKPYGSSKD